MAKKFPEIKEKNEGKFTAWVEKNMGGMDTCKAASKIMRSRTKKYSPAVVKMANYANNFGCKTKKDGASFNPKLKKAVADGKIKGKFAEKIMSSDGASLRSKRADKLVSQGRLHKKMSPEQKKEAIKNKSARFTQEGASMKKPPLKKIESKKAIMGLEKLKIRKGPKGTKYEGKQRMERGSEKGSHSYYSDNISEHRTKPEFDTNKSTQQQVTETGKYRTKEREKRHMKAALKSARKK